MKSLPVAQYAAASKRGAAGDDIAHARAASADMSSTSSVRPRAFQYKLTPCAAAMRADPSTIDAMSVSREWQRRAASEQRKLAVLARHRVAHVARRGSRATDSAMQ